MPDPFEKVKDEKKPPDKETKKSKGTKFVDTKPVANTLVHEHLPSGASASAFIHDFVHSKNSKFSGDSKKQRIKRALGAYYKRHRS